MRNSTLWKFSSFAALLLLVAFLLALSSAGAFACDASKRPKDTDINTWFCYRESNTAIVFVHGVLSNGLSSWLNTEVTPNTYWPEMIAQDPSFGSPAIFIAGYHSGLQAGQFGLTDAISEVQDGLFSKRPPGGGKTVMEFDRIFFVAHSLGGVVLRRLIVEKQDDFIEHQIGMVLLGSPSKGAQLATSLSILSGLMAEKRNDFQQKLEWQNDWIMTLHKDFRTLADSEEFRGRMRGLELFEESSIFRDTDTVRKKNVTEYIKNFFRDVALNDTLLERPVVPKESAGEYWNADNVAVAGTDHFSLVKPATSSDGAYTKVVNFFAATMFEAVNSECAQLPGFRVIIDSKKDQSGRLIPISVLRNEDDLSGDVDNEPVTPQIVGQKFEYFLPSGHPFPCRGEKFRAEVTRTVLSGDAQIAVSGGPLEILALCFKRTSDIQRQKNFAKANCTIADNGMCKLGGPAQRGLADPCDANVWNIFDDWHWPKLVASAQAAASELFWVTPSLDTLLKMPDDQRYGYTEFVVGVSGLPPATSASRYELTVRVNGIRIYFDGWPPEKLRKRYRGKGDLSLRFALDNLNFAGPYDGYDEIEVAVRVFAEGKGSEGEPVATAVSRRPYAALRDYEEPFHKLMRERSNDEGGKFDWSANFRPSTTLGRYAIMLLSRKVNTSDDAGVTDALASVAAAKDRLSAVGLRFSGQSVTGRIHPPRPSKDAVGLTLALTDTKGRIVSGFNQKEVRSLCAWLLQNRKKLFSIGAASADAFVFDFDPAFAGSRGFKPSYYQTCRSMVQGKS
jgi:hypothetical protein